MEDNIEEMEKMKITESTSLPTWKRKKKSWTRSKEINLIWDLKSFSFLSPVQLSWQKGQP